MKNKNSRREFIKKATYGGIGTAVASSFLLSCKTGTSNSVAASGVNIKQNHNVGLQLYTVRDGMTADLNAALKKVADIGYSQLELAGYLDGKFYGHTPAEFKKMVEDLGMTVISSHTGVEKGADMSIMQKMADAHAELGVKYCIEPWLIEERRTSIDSYKEVAEELNTIGEIMSKVGIQFGYHNHAFEFDTVEGKIPYYDVLIKETEPDKVVLELDLYWAVKAGHNPIEIFKKYPGRFALWHVKDMDNTEEQFFAPVGSGIIDFKEIFAHKEAAGMKYFFVEQDRTKGEDPFESINTSYSNLTTKILV
jgi:sugar phosphate isomerase/epimerase